MRRSDSILQQYYFSGLPKAQNGEETPGWFSRVSKDLKNLFGIEDEKPKQVVLTMPQKIKISDSRKKSLTTGKQIDPNRDLVTGEYPSDRIYNIVKAAKRYGIDPYTALAIELQETGFGTSKRGGNESVGHVLINDWEDKMVPTQFSEDDSPEFQPYDTFARAVATKMQEADRLGISDPYTRLQVYNGLGRISGNTEKDYHGFKMKSIYGVPIPAAGIDMRKNPLYGKRIIDLRDNVLKPNKDLEYWIKYIKASGGPIIKDNRGQWAHPGKVTRISGSNITMDGVPYPVLAKPNFGKSKVMMPGMNYKFPGAQYVDEYPINLNLPKLDSERLGIYAEPSIDFWQGKPYFGATVGYKTPKVALSANYMYGVPTVGARINFDSGGQHGGLDRWFAEKWVDVKTGKACGRQEGESRAYPACRPSRRVSSETPKTASEMSPAEKAKFKRSKTSSERINYNHKRMQEGGMLPQYQMRGQVMSTADSVRHQANKILQYEQLRGGPGGSPLPYYSDPSYMNMLMNDIYPQVRTLFPNASAMEAAEAMDFIFNAGWDKASKKITKDPRAYALQEYYRQYDPSKLDADGKWSGRKNPAYSFDQEYNTTIGKLPENDRRVMMNRGRDWYYRNINNPAPGVPNSNYYDTWYGRIWNTNDFLPFNPNNPNFKPKKK